MTVCPIPLTHLHLDSTPQAKLRPRNRSAEEGEPAESKSSQKEPAVQRSKSCKVPGLGKPLALPPKPEKSSGWVTGLRAWADLSMLASTYAEERAEAWGVRWRCCKLTMKLVAEFWSPRPGLRLPPLVGSGVRGCFYCSSFCSAFLRLPCDLCPLHSRSEGSSPNWLQALKLKKKKV